MKTLLIAGFALSTLALTGCGPNVENIQKHFVAKTGVESEYAMTGYTMVFTEESMKKAEAYVKENRIKQELALNDDLELLPLNKVDLKNDEYDKIIEIREAYEDQVGDLAKTVKKAIDDDTKKIKGEIANLEGERKSLELSLKDYNDAIAPHKAKLDKANADVKAIDEKRAENKEAFYKEFSRIVVEAELPIDKNARPEPSRFYRTDVIFDQKCDNRIDVKDSDDKPVAYCVVATIDQSQAALAPAFIAYGKVEKTLSSEKDLARKEVRNLQRQLDNAKVIATNKLNINVSKIERDIERVERQIRSKQSDLEFTSNLMRRLEQETSRNEAVREIRSNYSSALGEYHKSVRLESLARSDYEFDEISDEEDVPSLSEKERGVAVYVFTNDDDKQVIYMAPLYPKMEKNFASIFKQDAEVFSADFPVEDKKDVLKLVAKVM